MLAEPLGAAEHVAGGADALEPEVEVLLVRPADPAVYLGGHARDLPADLRDVGQDVAGQQGRLVGNRVEGMGRVPEEGSRGLELCDHLRAHVLHGLKGTDHPVELLALSRIGDGLRDHRLAGTQGVRRQRDATGVEHAFDGGLGALEDRLGFDVREEQFRGTARGVRGEQPIGGEPRGSTAHHRQISPAKRHENEVGLAAVHGHHGLAGELVVCELHPRSFADGDEFRDGQPETDVARRDAAHPFLALAPAQGAQCRGHHHPRAHEGGGGDCVAQGLGHQRCVQQAQVAAPQRLGDQDAGDPQLGEGTPDRHVVRAALVAQFAHPGDGDLVAEEVADGLLEQQLVFRESEIHALPSSALVLRPVRVWAPGEVPTRARR